MSRAPVTNLRLPDAARRREWQGADRLMDDLPPPGDEARDARMRDFARAMMRRFPKITDHLARN